MTPLEDLLQQCTVKITVPGGWGTGFFVATGLILTCAHVVRKAANLQITVFYPAREAPLSAIVKAKADDGKTLDLALVELAEPLPDHPCVLLDEEPVAIGQALYSYGYLESYTNAAPVRPVNEGLTGDTPPLLKLQGAQIEKGISGAALLNLKTGKVCGMVKETRAAGFDLGGGAIPTRVILEQFPELRELQREFHGGDRRWSDVLVKLTPTGGMIQTNLGGHNYQTQTGANNTNYIGETHIYNYATPQLEARSSIGKIDVQPYLNSVVTTYEKWWQYYTLTDAESKQRQKQESAPIFDFGLMVQTVLKKTQEQEQQEKENVERCSVLDGLRKYALGEKPEPVLLVGRPGSGKSTALARLMLEEATTQMSEFSNNPDVSAHSPQIPILVELRYWQESIAQLILNALKRHDLAVASDQLETVLKQSLILFDGVNELPSEEARTQLSAFRRNHPNLPMIFTTRDLSLGGDLGIEKKLEMLPLTEAQMKEFIRAYVPDQAEAMLRQLNNRLREFGQTPLLLWMLCEVFQQSPNQQMPTNLAEVFRAFTTMYEDSSVRKHEVALLKGDVRALSDRRLWKDALKALAALMMQGETPVDFHVAIHRTEAERELGKIFAKEQFPVRDILDDLLKYHLLQNRTTEQLEFRHQLIQEYYAAEHLLRLLPELSDEQFKRDHLNLLKWTEPIALMLGFCEDNYESRKLVTLALEIDPFLAAELAKYAQVNYQEEVIKCIISSSCYPTLLKVQLLADTNSEMAVDALGSFLESCDEYVRWVSARALGSIDSNKSVKMLEKIIDDESLGISWAAAESLGRIGSNYSIKILSRTIFDRTSKARKAAINSLSSIPSKRAVRILKRVAIEKEDILKVIAEQALARVESNSFPLTLEGESEKIPTDASRITLAFSGKNTKETESIKKYSLENFRRKTFLDQQEIIQKLMRVDAVDDLLQLLGGNNLDIRIRSLILLGLKELGKAENLKELWRQQLLSSDILYKATIRAIQDRCKFYNYEIFQAHLAAQKSDRQNSQSDKPTNVFNIDTLHAPNAAINLGGIIHGDQIGAQSHPLEP